MSEFFAMGGYAAYVWPAYILSAAVIGVLTVHSVLRYRRMRDRLLRLERELERHG